MHSGCSCLKITQTSSLFTIVGTRKDTLKSGWTSYVYRAYFSVKWGNHSKRQFTVQGKELNTGFSKEVQ